MKDKDKKEKEQKKKRNKKKTKITKTTREKKIGKRIYLVFTKNNFFYKLAMAEFDQFGVIES